MNNPTNEKPIDLDKAQPLDSTADAPIVIKPTPKKSRNSKLSTFREMLVYFSSGKRWWMAPLVLLLGIIGLVLAILQSIPAVAPFIYVAF
jgi:hypothetical protein